MPCSFVPLAADRIGLRACAETIERPRFWYLRCGWRVHRDQTSPFHICQIAFEAVSPTPILCTSGQNRDRSIVSVQALTWGAGSFDGPEPAAARVAPTPPAGGWNRCAGATGCGRERSSISALTFRSSRSCGETSVGESTRSSARSPPYLPVSLPAKPNGSPPSRGRSPSGTPEDRSPGSRHHPPREGAAAWAWLCRRSALGERREVDFEASRARSRYRAADALLHPRDAIENHRFHRIPDRFGIEPTIPLYDRTNPFSEGRAAQPPKARFGRSQERRSEGRLRTLGRVPDGSGFVRRSRVFEGHVSEGSTRETLLAGLRTPAGARVPGCRDRDGGPPRGVARPQVPLPRRPPPVRFRCRPCDPHPGPFRSGGAALPECRSGHRRDLPRLPFRDQEQEGTGDPGSIGRAIRDRLAEDPRWPLPSPRPPSRRRRRAPDRPDPRAMPSGCPTRRRRGGHRRSRSPGHGRDREAPAGSRPRTHPARRRCPALPPHRRGGRPTPWGAPTRCARTWRPCFGR